MKGVKQYPLMGSLFGYPCGRQNHERGARATAEVPWCEECAMLQKELSYWPSRIGRARGGNGQLHNDAVLKGQVAEWPELGCWEWVKREHVRTQVYVNPCYCERCPGQPNHKASDHKGPDGRVPWYYDASKPIAARRTCDDCPCPRYKWEYQNREVYVPKPKHMIRCGIPWSRRYAPPGYLTGSSSSGVLMQDFVCTFGRRYVSPNYWTSNAPHPAYYNDRIYYGYKEAKALGKEPNSTKSSKLRPYGGRAFHVFPSLDAAVPLVRQKALAFRAAVRMRSGNTRDCDPYQLEAAFFQWARLGKVPFYPNRITQRTAMLNTPGDSEKWNMERNGVKQADTYSGLRVDPMTGIPY